jgi:hypothetical protein
VSTAPDNFSFEDAIAVGQEAGALLPHLEGFEQARAQILAGDRSPETAAELHQAETGLFLRVDVLGGMLDHCQPYWLADAPPAMDPQAASAVEALLRAAHHRIACANECGRLHLADLLDRARFVERHAPPVDVGALRAAILAECSLMVQRAAFPDRERARLEQLIWADLERPCAAVVQERIEQQLRERLQREAAEQPEEEQRPESALRPVNAGKLPEFATAAELARFIERPDLAKRVDTFLRRLWEKDARIRSHQTDPNGRERIVYSCQAVWLQLIAWVDQQPRPS